MFAEWTLLDRPAAASDAGFSAIEMQFPYDVPADALASACARAGVECALINLPPGQLAKGDLGLAAIPGREKEFEAGIELGCAYAMALGCRAVNSLAGNRPTGVSPDLIAHTLAANTRLAAEKMMRAGLILLVEPLNRRDHPNFVLTNLVEFDALVSSVDHPNLQLQFDVYHRYAEAEDVSVELTMRLPQIGHIQFSDYPGRHEPGTGVQEFDRLFASIAQSDYSGWVGAEYRPLEATSSSLNWFKPYR